MVMARRRDGGRGWLRVSRLVIGCIGFRVRPWSRAPRCCFSRVRRVSHGMRHRDIQRRHLQPFAQPIVGSGIGRRMPSHRPAGEIRSSPDGQRSGPTAAGVQGPHRWRATHPHRPDLRPGGRCRVASRRDHRLRDQRRLVSGLSEWRRRQAAHQTGPTPEGGYVRLAAVLAWRASAPVHDRIDRAGCAATDCPAGSRDADDQHATHVARRGTHYVPSGHLVYASGATLKAIAFDATAGVVRGDP